ncbi:MAG: DUF4292 domain-containing protein [Flavobacteriales bacterium]|nr:DUF4292 domain-containing protein [Flavobacteriales bacterium]
MNNRPFSLFILIATLASFYFASCKNSKGIIRHGKVENLSTAKLLDSISKHCFSFEYFTTRIATDVSFGDNSKSFKTHLKIRTDSAIWMTFTVASFVGANALITTDSMKFVNKMDKEYFLGTFDYINAMFNTELDYFMLQDLLVGNLINFDPTAKYKTKEDTSYYFISTVGKRKLKKAFDNERIQKKEPFIYRYWINPGSFRPARTIINDLSDTTELQVDYLEYEMSDSLLVPSLIHINASAPGKKAHIELKFSRTKVNEFTEFPFKIPEGYEKME